MKFLTKVFRRYKLQKILFECSVLVVGYPLYFLSFLIPRNKDKWVLGNKASFADNAKYLYLYIFENTTCQVYWISSSKKTVRELQSRGLPSFYKYSLLGLYHALTAKYYICTVSTNYINFWTSGGAVKVNLWHGVGLKKLNDDAAWLRDKSFLSRILMPYGYEHYQIFLATSKLMIEHFSKSFCIPDKYIYEGIYPRCYFLMQDKELIRQHIKRYESSVVSELVASLEKFNHIYIYMPTWRLSFGREFLNYAFDDIVLLNEVLAKNNNLLLLKLHPSMEYDMYRYGELHNIKYIDSNIDVYPLLPFTDVLITDYSSIYYDYLLMKNKCCVLYDFDYENYVINEFNFILDYKTYTPGRHVSSFNELLLFLTEDLVEPNPEREWILSEFWGNYKEHTTKDLYLKINTLY